MRALTYMTLMTVSIAWTVAGANAAALRVNPAATGPQQNGTTWDNAFRSLQPALDAAAPGDEVWVVAGAYSGGFTVKAGTLVLGGFAGTEATRAERDLSANPTTLDGGNTSPTVTVQTGTFATMLDHLTITHGVPVGIAAPDAVLLVNECRVAANETGMAVSGATAILKSHITDNAGTFGVTAFGNLEVEDSVVSGNGTGIKTTGGITSILRNIIRKNSNTGLEIGPSVRSPTTIRGNLIERNANGGIRVAGGSPQILNNTVRNNTTTGDGAGIAVTSGPATIAHNVISGNVSGAMGGGILAGASLRITNNTIANNVAAVRGGGIHVAGSIPPGVTVSIENTVLAYNRGGISRLGPASVLIRNCDVFANAEDFQGVPDPAPADGNISVEPQFADPFLSDLHIQPTSPLRDAGDNAYVSAGAEDMDGQPRIQPAGGTVDIGADESDGTSHTVIRKVVRVKPDGDDGQDGSTWAAAKKTVQAAVNALEETRGGEVWVAQGTYNELITLGPGVSLRGGFVGTEEAGSEAQPETYVTVLDGGTVGAVVTIPFGTGGGQSITGFTIRHQHKTGIGIEAHSASLFLGHNVVTSNDEGLQSDNSIVTTTFNRFSGNNFGVTGVASGFLDDNEIQDNMRAGIQVIAPSLFVRHNIISGNGTGVEAHGTTTVVGNTVLNNTGEHGIRLTGTPTVTDNSVRGNGYGIHISHGQAVRVSDNVVQTNRNRGIHLEQEGGAEPAVERNAVIGNAGGGLYLSGGMPRVTGNTVRDNTRTGNGAGIEVGSGGPILANNAIAGNTATGTGGGLYLLARESADFVKVFNNTVAGNQATSGAGGIRIEGGASLQGSVFLANNIVAHNSSGIGKAGTVQTVLRFNDVYGNGVNYDGLEDPTGIEGNVSVDPEFVGAGIQDLHLRGISPLRNAGDTTAVQEGWTDIDGEARVQEVAVDIGADEVAGLPYALPDVLRALRIAAGVQAVESDERARLDVHPALGANGGRTGDGAITIHDVRRLLSLL